MQEAPTSGSAVAVTTEAEQPYAYRPREVVEPDWRRLPGFAKVSPQEWRDATWQRRNSVTSVKGLAAAFGRFLPEDLAHSVAADQAQLATMRLRLTPQVLNTMNERSLWADPLRRYLIPASADRESVWHTHPMARRDSLRENEMTVVEGLVRRYPTKALVELASTCPVYCGMCTRMDLVGPSTPLVDKRTMNVRLDERCSGILRELEAMPTVRDVVISGGDLANVSPTLLEAFVDSLLKIRHVRSFRIATKAVTVLPQHFLQDDVVRAMERIARRAREAEVEMAVHVHANHAQAVTPLVVAAARRLRAAGVDTIRNQGVIMRHVNATAEALLDLCFALLDEARIAPYYFYVCDLIPHAEHWRTSIHTAQQLQAGLMGYLPGFATPRIVCDVPHVGKRWVDQAVDYDRVRGISYWTKNYWTPVDDPTGNPMARTHPYFDPVAELPEEGREYWSRWQGGGG